MGFYRIVSDPGIEDRWVLGTPVGPTIRADPDWLFASVPLPVEDYVIETLRPGRPVDFVLSSSGAPIVSASFANILRAVADPCLQLLPVAGVSAAPYFAVNAFRRIVCLDEDRSLVLKWKAEDRRPDRIGQYRAVYKIAIDDAHVPPEAQMFRIEGWPMPVIVTEALKARIEASGLSGAAFQPCEGKRPEDRIL